MQKITVRRVVLGSILLCMSLMAIFTLFFNVIYLDIGSGSREIYEDNAFNFLMKNSYLLDSLLQMNVVGVRSMIENCQTICAIFIFCAIGSFSFGASCFFFAKTERFFRCAIIAIFVDVIAYMIFGIIIRNKIIAILSENCLQWQEISGISINVGELSVIKRQLRTMVKTSAFAPFVIEFVLLVGYVLSSLLIKRNGKVIFERKTHNYEQIADRSDGNKRIDVGYLLKLKQLFDEGILTEEEFMEQKRLALGKKE